MLCNINQKSDGLRTEIKREGCLFLCLAESSPLIFSGKEGISALNYLWEKAVKNKIISTANILLDHNGLLDLFCVQAKYDNKHHSSAENIDPRVQIVVGQFVWKAGHFVVLNKNKEVIFDPLVISNSVKNGELKSMRWYYAD